MTGRRQKLPSLDLPAGLHFVVYKFTSRVTFCVWSIYHNEKVELNSIEHVDLASFASVDLLGLRN